MEQIGMAVVAVISSLLLISHAAFGKFYGRTDDQVIFHYPSGPPILERQSQNSEEKYWENLKGTNFPLTLVNWQLITKPGSSDKYMDKRIIGTAKNNSEIEFSEVKIEFTVYDEEGNQIALVFSNSHDFKPGGIWKFEIPVTSDVDKAEFNGLYVPLKELKNLRGKAY